MGEKIYMVMERRYNDRCGRDSHVCLGCFASEDEAEKYLKNLLANNANLYYHTYICVGECKDGITDPSKYKTEHLYTISVRRSFSTEMLYASIMSHTRSFVEVKTDGEEMPNRIDGVSLSEHSTAMTIDIALSTEDSALAICIAKYAVRSLLAATGERIHKTDITKWLSNPVKILMDINDIYRDSSNVTEKSFSIVYDKND